LVEKNKERFVLEKPNVKNVVMETVIGSINVLVALRLAMESLLQKIFT